MNKKTNCNLCAHGLLCKYKEIYESLIKSCRIEIDGKEIENPESFIEILECKYYTDSPIQKILGDLYPGPLYPDNSSKDPCENCPSRPVLNGGYIYTGDSVCQWCPNSPYRVTCEDK